MRTDLMEFKQYPEDRILAIAKKVPDPPQWQIDIRLDIGFYDHDLGLLLLGEGLSCPGDS